MTESKLQPLLITTVTAWNWTPNILPNATMSKIILQHVYQDYKCNPHQLTWNDHDCIEEILISIYFNQLLKTCEPKNWMSLTVKKIFVRNYKAMSYIHEFQNSCLYLQFSWHTCEVMELGQVSPLEVNGTGNLPVQIDSTCFMLKKKKAKFSYWPDTCTEYQLPQCAHSTCMYQCFSFYKKTVHRSQSLALSWPLVGGSHANRLVVITTGHWPFLWAGWRSHWTGTTGYRWPSPYAGGTSHPRWCRPPDYRLSSRPWCCTQWPGPRSISWWVTRLSGQLPVNKKWWKKEI